VSPQGGKVTRAKAVGILAAAAAAWIKAHPGSRYVSEMKAAVKVVKKALPAE